jgi:pimeloyl-ACP methyl ester carboxylesterase
MPRDQGAPQCFMNPKKSIRSADLRGAARLATGATTGLVDLVEAMHARIARGPGNADRDATRGITRGVYKTVRGLARIVGSSVDSLLGLLAPTSALEVPAPRPEREALVAVLNGVLGDHLQATANPLATTMAFRREGRALALDAASIQAVLPDAGGKLLVLIHGLCMNDLQWTRAGHDHGAALGQALGFTPIYLHYNSGLHISTQGHALAQELESLVEHWPLPVERLVLLGHSMGGLVARSAVHAGAQAAHRWPAVLSDMVFLGTPHHGAPLERAGNWIEALLGATPYAAPLARLGKLRSAGITDLRHGNLLDEDWTGHDRFERRGDHRKPVPLPAGVRCFTVATSLGSRSGNLKTRLLGDGLVPLDSALGRHTDPARRLAFTPDHQWIGHRIGHLDMLGHPQVYEQLLRWLGSDFGTQAYRNARSA